MNPPRASSGGGNWIAAGRIVRVSPWAEMAKSASGEALDLGEVTLLPGLVNAHCHLDYTAAAGMLPPPIAVPSVPGPPVCGTPVTGGRPA